MIADLDGMIERFGPPVAVLPDRDDEIIDAVIRQQLSAQTHEHARMYALLRLHLRYPGNVVVTTLHDTEPTSDFDIIWRFAVTLLDQFGHAGTGEPEESSLDISGRKHPATKVGVTNDFDARLDGCAAHIPDRGRTIVAIGPPERLHNLHLEWLAPV